MTAQWTVIVPLLTAPEAPTRFGVDAATTLRAIALDTISAIAASSAVAQTLVITDDPQIATQVASVGPNITVTDIDVVAATGTVAGPLAIMHPTLPTLDSTELTAFLNAAQHVALGVVTNTEDTGTTVLVANSTERLNERDVRGFLASRAPAGAVALGSGATLRRTVTSARHMSLVRHSPTLGARTRATAAAIALEPGSSSGRRYGIDPPPQN